MRVESRTPLDPWGTEEEEYCRDPSRPRKVHYKTGWKLLEMLFIGSTLGEHKRKAQRFWQPKSHAIITNSTVPLDCIERAMSQYGEMTIYLRSSITAGKTQSEAPSLDNAAKEGCSFQVDLRVHGVSQDDIYKDEERMTEMQHLVDRLQDGYRDKFIIKDLQQEGVSNVFSEDSKKAQATRGGQHRAVRT